MTETYVRPKPPWWSAVVDRRLDADSFGSTKQLPVDEVRRAKFKLQRDLRDTPGVLGVGVGVGGDGSGPHVVVFVSNVEAADMVPHGINGVSVRIEVRQLPVAH